MAVDAVLRGPAPVTWPSEDTHHPEQCDPVQLTGAFAPDGATCEIACSIGADSDWSTS